MSGIRKHFDNLGFHTTSYNKIPNHAAFISDVNINSNKYGFLTVESNFADEKFLDELLILKHLEREIRYMLLLDTRLGIGVFVKRTLSPAGTNKFQKHRIRFNSRASEIVISSLNPDDYTTFENLFNTEKVVSRFYSKYVKHLKNLTDNINGLTTKSEKQHYAAILMSRLMFMQFLQTRNFFPTSNFLSRNFELIHSKNRSYYKFLCKIFFDLLNTPKDQRSGTVSQYSNIEFLNGGLFRKHTLEKQYKHISVDNKTLSSIIDFFRSWTWYIDETDVSNDGINPEILGHIFEQTIDNQKDKGAFYTPVDVTRHICENTIIPYIIERINNKFQLKYALNNVSFDQILKNKKHAAYMYFEVLKPLTILDNACGSGEFLLRAFGILLDLYDRLWKVLSHFNDPKITREKLIIEKSNPSPRYYFRRHIVTKNLFGVDMDYGAIEVCQLRLWLGLVADMDLDSPEALPNIDYNILPGNTLLGFIMPNSLQSNFTTNIPTQHDYNQIADLKNDYRNATDPAVALEIKTKLDATIAKCHIQLSAALYKNKKKYGVFNPEHLPFHWILNFPTIMQNGGFDIIVGNPPYVESQKINFPLQFKLFSCNNTYAYFIEKSLCLLKPGGKLGYIIPVSIVSTPRMVPVLEHLKSNCSDILISNFDDRPGKLFVGLEHCRSSIFICTLSKTNCRIYTTGYIRWNTRERNTLFDNIKYVDVTRFALHPRLGKLIPKIANELEISILEKLLTNTDSLSKHTVKTSQAKKTNLYTIYYYNAAQYGIRAHMHEIKSTRIKNGIRSQVVSSHLKPIYHENSHSQIIALALLNSSLFYWWFIKMSSGRDFGKFLINLFPINIDKLINNKKTILKLSKIVSRLMIDYENNSMPKTNVRKDNSVLTYPEYFPSKSKHIIDEIDDVFGAHYDFTEEELCYIRLFDSKFRSSLTI